MADISLLPKEYSVKSAPATKETKLFTVLVVLIFLGVFGAWGGIYFYNNQTRESIDAIKEEMAALPISEKEQEVEKIEEANKKLEFLGGILNAHTNVSGIFNETEKFTLKKVYFNRLNIDVAKNLLELSGTTDSYSTFAKQYNELNNNTEIARRVEIDKVSTTKDGVDFQVKIYLADGVFLKN